MYNAETLERFSAKIKKYDSSYEVPDIVATEKSEYNAKAIILVLVALGIGLLIALPWFNFYY